MGLKVWFPFDGRYTSIKNRGQQTLSWSSSGLTAVAEGGKTGGCYSFNGSSSHLTYTGFSTAGLSEMTVCLWVNPATTDASNTNGIFAFNYTGSYYQFTVRSGYLYIRDNSVNYNGTAKKYSIGTIDANIWTHLAFVYDHGTLRMYKNGEQIGTDATIGGTALNATQLTHVGKASSSGYYYNGKLCDFRVYDNSLSAKEVKELSKGLIVHFPLDNIGSLGSRLSSVKYNNRIYNGDFSAGTSNWTTFSNCNWSVSDGVLTVSKASSSGAGGTVRSTASTFNTSHLYYIKTVTRVTGTGSGRGVFTGFASSSNTVNSNSQIQVYSENWTETSVVTSPTTTSARLIIRSGTSDSAAGVAAQCKFYMCVDLTNAFGSGNEPTKEECDAIFAGYGWDYMAYDADYSIDLSSDLHDCSGYCNDAELDVGNPLSLVKDTRRNEYSTVFDGSTVFSAPSPTTEAKSVSFWFKCPESIQTKFALFVDYKSGLGFGFGTSVVGVSTNYSATAFAKTLFTAGNWYHVVIVNPGTSPSNSTRKLYVNGEEATGLASSSNTYWTQNTEDLQIGGLAYNMTNYPAFNGYISDFRMYAAPLSADQVKELYDTSAWIDNLGDVSAVMLREGKSWPTRTVNTYDESPQVEASGILRTENLIESSPYLMVNNGSVFLKILDHNNPASNIFTANNCWLNNSGNLYSCLDILRTSDIFKGAEEFEFYSTEKLTSSSTETSVRWIQTSNPATTSSATGFSLVSGTASYLTAGLANAGTKGCFDISGSTWWCCCGAYNQYKGGVPGFNGVVTTGYLRLWVKLPDEVVKGSADDIAKFFKRSVYARHFYEV